MKMRNNYSFPLDECYRILNVMPGADYSSIKANYRMLAKQNHPDNGGNQEDFIKIKRAFEILAEHIDSVDVAAQTEGENFNPQEIFDGYIVYAVEKYNGIENAFKYIEAYVQGNQSAITRDNNYRELFSKYLSPAMVMQIANGNLRFYVELIGRSKDDSFNLFMAACKATYRIYGYNQLLSALNRGINGDYKCFTNDNKRGLRDRMYMKISPEIFRNYITSLLNGNIDYSKPLGDQAVDVIIQSFNIYHEAKQK